MKKKKLLCAVLALGLVASMSSVALAGSVSYSGSATRSFSTSTLTKPSSGVWSSAMEQNNYCRRINEDGAVSHNSTVVTSGGLAMGYATTVHNKDQSPLSVLWYKDTNTIQMLLSVIDEAFSSSGVFIANYY